MNDQPILETVTNKLIERWKTVMTEGQRAKDAQNELTVSIYQQERHFLEKLLDELTEKLPSTEWEAHKQRQAPDILFSPDSTFVQPRF